MQKSPDELHLSESYNFEVTIENNGTHFAGELSLTPRVCILIIRGDISGDRRHAFDIEGLSELTCDCFGGMFFLLGLKGDGASIKHMHHGPTPVSHFEIKYKVSHVIYSRAILSRDIGFLEIEVDSSSIAQWVGYTQTQDHIVFKNINGTLFPFTGVLPTEFEQPINGLGTLRIVYHPSTYHSVETFSMGLRYSPSLSLLLDGEKTAEQVIERVGDLDTLFSFLIGRAPDLNTVKLRTARGRMHSLSLYFPRPSSEVGNRDYPWFPLGKNLRIDMGLPQFPITSFSGYFDLPIAERMHFKKYVRYREMQNPEERFLGFFRLLEKLCFRKESFLPENRLITLIERAGPFLIRYFDDKKNVKRILKKIIDLNHAKLNTAGCINVFIKKIPSTLLDKWIYGSSDIESICNLRNDLTHANDIELKEYEIDRKAKFIETLLILRLLVKMGIPIDDGATIAPRIKSHQLIEKPPEITYSLNDGN